MIILLFIVSLSPTALADSIGFASENYTTAGVIFLSKDIYLDTEFVFLFDSTLSSINNDIKGINETKRILGSQVLHLIERKDIAELLDIAHSNGLDGLFFICKDTAINGVRIKFFSTYKNIVPQLLPDCFKKTKENKIWTFSLYGYPYIGITYPTCFIIGGGYHWGGGLLLSATKGENQKIWTNLYIHSGKVTASFVDAYEEFDFIEKGIRIIWGQTKKHLFSGYGIGCHFSNYKIIYNDISGTKIPTDFTYGFDFIGILNTKIITFTYWLSLPPSPELFGLSLGMNFISVKL